jgi:hypothetical protein
MDSELYLLVTNLFTRLPWTIGQGNRVKGSCGDEACEEVVVPSGDFAPEAQGVLA